MSAMRSFLYLCFLYMCKPYAGIVFWRFRGKRTNQKPFGTIEPFVPRKRNSAIPQHSAMCANVRPLVSRNESRRLSKDGQSSTSSGVVAITIESIPQIRRSLLRANAHMEPLEVYSGILSLKYVTFQNGTDRQEGTSTSWYGNIHTVADAIRVRTRTSVISK
jgi:hypothetical protein